MGTKVREVHQGFEAIVGAIQFHHNGCQRAVLHEKRLKEDKLMQMSGTDIQTLEVIEVFEKGLRLESDAASDILGLRAKDTTLGIEGVIAVVEILPGGERLAQLQPKRIANAPIQGYWVSEAFLELLEPRREKVKPTSAPGYENVGPSQSR